MSLNMKNKFYAYLLFIASFCVPNLTNASQLDHLVNSIINQKTIVHIRHADYSSKPKVDSSSALVLDSINNTTLYKKNIHRISSIASISKLMTAMVTLDAALPMDELITITNADVDHLKNSKSRLQVGTTLPRKEVLLLALMSSENRAAHALSRTYPGGTISFVASMNRKARSLGMVNTVFYDPTGLTPRNVSTALDLAIMVKAAYKYRQIRQDSTWHDYQIIAANGKVLTYKNSNQLVREGMWDISLQKTGYIKESGKCMVVRVTISSQPLIIILLDAENSINRVNDAKVLKTWLEKQPELLLQRG